MEQRVVELQARQATVSAFGDLVNAMRGVAAARAQRARQLIAGVDAYAATVAAAIAQARDLPADTSPSAAHPGAAPLLLVFCAEQGFNGGFSEQILATVPQGGAARVLLLGSHGIRLAAARGIVPEWAAPLIAHAEGAVAAGERLHAALAHALARQPAAFVDMVHAQLQEGQHFGIHRHRLLPLDAGAVPMSREPAPLVHLAPARLLDDLAFEHVAAQLTRALLHSHAAENVSRLQAMAAAHENVERMTSELDADARRLRQQSITAEIVELAAGLRAQRAVGT